jgi:tRNA(fMet)-specific endonuclease VapC
MIRRIGREDAWIASIALAHDATVLTANKSDFQQVPELKVENWLTRHEAT